MLLHLTIYKNDYHRKDWSGYYLLKTDKGTVWTIWKHIEDGSLVSRPAKEEPFPPICI
jgi:hypothetical protein